MNVINLQETRADFRIRSYGPNGAPLPMLRQVTPGGVQAVNDLMAELPGRGTLRLTSFAEPGQLSVGWAFLNTTHALGVEVVFNIFSASGGELLTATNVRVGLLHKQAAFFAFNQFREGAAGVLEPQGAGRRVRSGLALLNPLGNVSPARVELSVFDRTGEALGAAAMTLGLGQRTSRFIDELVSGLPDFEGSVRLRSFNPNDPEQEVFVAAMPLRQEDIVLTTQLAFPPVATQPAPAGEGPPNRFFWIPQYGHGVVAVNNLLFTTEVYVLNLQADPSEYRLEAYDEAGEPLRAIGRQVNGSVSPVSVASGVVPVGGTARINSASDPGQLALGSAILTSNDAIAAEVVFNIFDATSGELLTSTNVALTPIVTAISFFAFDQFREGAEGLGQSPQGARRRVRSGLAVFNPPLIPGITDGVGARVDLFALDPTGVIVGEGFVNVAPGQRVSRFIDELIADIPDFEGSIEIRTSGLESGVPVALLPLRQEDIILTTQSLFPPRVLRER